YLPPAIAAGNSYLVVEGVINTGQDSTIIHLSRTVPLSSTVGTNPELSAAIVIESDANGSYSLTESGKGYYSAPGLNLSSSNKYRLKITTADNKIYQSDFVVVKNSPPIDSVYFQIKSNGIQINADAHDASNSTQYYRWAYDETYETHSAFYSSGIVSTTPQDTVLFREPKDQIYTCWKTTPSNNIVLGSTAKLSQDVIKGSEITSIASSSEKLAVRYSILVKQYALTKEAFNYWQQLKKNTEQLGSIFDAQPSEIAGNIHSITNPSETVIGYISAGTYAKTRIFIDTHDLPTWRSDNPYLGCKMDTAYFSHPKTNNNDVAEYIYSGLEIPIFSIPQHPGPPLVIIAYAASSPDCTDCRLRGGTNQQPAFWR
ncbi:MAG: DUF4249 domain-containing protein, partial [Mucilaginibacter sp.]